jgi:hypothetical protein
VIALRPPKDGDAVDGARFELHFKKNRGRHGDDAKPFEAPLGANGWTMQDLAGADLARAGQLKAEGLPLWLPFPLTLLLALLIGVFLSAYVWAPYVRDAVFKAAEALLAKR